MSGWRVAVFDIGPSWLERRNCERISAWQPLAVGEPRMERDVLMLPILEDVTLVVRRGAVRSVAIVQHDGKDFLEWEVPAPVTKGTTVELLRHD